jgi:hypothetical protein
VIGQSSCALYIRFHPLPFYSIWWFQTFNGPMITDTFSCEMLYLNAPFQTVIHFLVLV